VFGKGFQIIDLKSQMGDIRAYVDRAAFVKLAKLDFFLASGGLQENQL
jgi:hypothetical protein